MSPPFHCFIIGGRPLQAERPVSVVSSASTSNAFVGIWTTRSTFLSIRLYSELAILHPSSGTLLRENSDPRFLSQSYDAFLKLPESCSSLILRKNGRHTILVRWHGCGRIFEGMGSMWTHCPSSFSSTRGISQESCRWARCELNSAHVGVSMWKAWLPSVTVLVKRWRK